jgi:hypothetical protein
MLADIRVGCKGRLRHQPQDWLSRYEPAKKRRPTITKPDFEAALGVEGYVEIETKMPPRRPENDDHGHRHAVKGLVLEPVLL